MSIFSFIETLNFNFTFNYQTLIGRKIIGFGVGGLVVYPQGKDVTDHLVLVYWRPKPVEQHKWSIPGGLVPINNDIQSVLQIEINNIVGLTVQTNRFHPLRVTIHQNNPDDRKERYHFISPAYLILIRIHEYNTIKRMPHVTNNSVDEFLYSKNCDDLAKQSLRDALIGGSSNLHDWDDEITRQMKSCKNKSKKYLLRFETVGNILHNELIYTSTTIAAIESYVELNKYMDQNCLNCPIIKDNFSFKC